MAQSEAKKALRARLREQLRAMSAETLAAHSQAAAHRLFAAEAFRRSEVVMLVLPLPYELDARPIALRCWQMGKLVTVPLVSFAQKRMLPLEIRSLEEPM